MKITKKQLLRGIILSMLIMMVGAVCFAAGTASDLPWEAPLQKIVTSLTGPVAMFLATITAVATGAMIAFGEGGAAGRKMLQIVCGISISVAGAGFIKSLFDAGTLLVK